MPLGTPARGRAGTFEVEGAHELRQHGQEEVAGLPQQLANGGLAQLRAAPQESRRRLRFRLLAQQADGLRSKIGVVGTRRGL